MDSFVPEFFPSGQSQMRERLTLAGVTIVGATLAAMMVCAFREAARMVAMRGTARTMWNMVNSVERIRK